MSLKQFKTGLTIVVPVYNEEESLPRLERELGEYMAQTQVDCDVLFVDDGSKDGSLVLMREICKRSDGFHFISFKENRGLSAAIKAGFDHVKREWTGYMDADLQTTPLDFDLLWSHREGYALVTGIRARRQDSPMKRFSSSFANGFRRMFTKDGIADTGCPLKIIKTEVAQRVPMFKGLHRFLPAMVMLQHGQVKQIEVRHFPREEGASKFNVWNRLLGPLGDCFAYLWMKRKYINYEIAEQDGD